MGAPRPRRRAAARVRVGGGRAVRSHRIPSLNFHLSNVVELHLVDLQLHARRRRLSGSVRRRAARRQQRHAQPAKSKATEHGLDLREKVVRRALAAEGCEWRARRRRVGLSSLDANLLRSAARTVAKFSPQLLAFPRAAFVGVAARLDGGADGAAVVVVAPHRCQVQLTRRARLTSREHAARSRSPRLPPLRRRVVVHVHTWRRPSVLSRNARPPRPRLRLRGSRRRRRRLSHRRLLPGPLLRHGRRRARQPHRRRLHNPGQVCVAVLVDWVPNERGRQLLQRRAPPRRRGGALARPRHPPVVGHRLGPAERRRPRRRQGRAHEGGPLVGPLALRRLHVVRARRRRRPRRRVRWPCPPPRPPPRRAPPARPRRAASAATSCARSGRSSALRVRKLRDGDSSDRRPACCGRARRGHGSRNLAQVSACPSARSPAAHAASATRCCASLLLRPSWTLPRWSK